MRGWLTGRYRVLWGTRYWNPYPTLAMDPNSHPDHKTNQPNNQPTMCVSNIKEIHAVVTEFCSENENADAGWTDGRRPEIRGEM